MENKTSEIVNNLKTKIDAIEKKAKSINTKEAYDIKEKAIDILNRVTTKFVDASRNVTSNEEYEQGFAFVQKKSDELYESVMNKLNQLTPKQDFQQEIKKDPAVEEIDSFIQEVKEKKDEIVKENIVISRDNEVEEKAISVLKEWLTIGKDS